MSVLSVCLVAKIDVCYRLTCIILVFGASLLLCLLTNRFHMMVNGLQCLFCLKEMGLKFNQTAQQAQRLYNFSMLISAEHVNCPANK